VCILASCGSNSCEISDWLGTYTLDMDSVSGCANVTDLDPTAVIVTGSTEGTINISGVEFNPDSETCKAVNEDLTVELDGDQIKIILGPCTAIYK